ncbi:FAD-binding and (Fe-S)-binding domain-containing protein [Schaalia sp. ZJ1691]|uniref:FAD-binding and (Fe-S)-binding domain-containing protein n=1 Tax=Schaalia sp. ZJ1691 TaxID=2709404 RepID=UPI001F14E684|nr:FAD-binding and (Fe-S)-binding domain-containing protein [Schaalia sp. ZJ1691]
MSADRTPRTTSDAAMASPGSAHTIPAPTSGPYAPSRSATLRDLAPVNGTQTDQAWAPSSLDNDPRIAQFFTELRQAITGEVDTHTATRARYSTDAGLYRIPPLGVVYPRTRQDVVTTLDLCRSHAVPVTNRGGGTSCSGNAIGPGIVIDFTRHLNRVLSIDPETKTAVVEPGCIESTLQAAAKPFGLRFGPDPSSQNRATIGGMVGNNACGPHATAWGRTASNIVSMECVDGTGRHFTARTSHDSAIHEIPGLAHLIDTNLETIRTELGRFSRQVSGYSLELLTPEHHRNLAAMLVGTEGTLVTILEVTVKLVDLPAAPVLVALGYPDMIAAADDVPALLEHHPLAVEGLDSRLVDVVRHHNGPGSVPDLPAGNGWLMCEMSSDTVEDSLARARELAASAHTDAVAIYPPGEDATRLWRIRADGAGLGGRTPVNTHTGGGNEQAWPGFEDAAVPPQHLGAYLRDFTALMTRYGIDGLLYGHFGDGCVHVRLNFPIETDDGVAHTRRFLEEAAQICARHGGSVSGEHGDGRTRSELLRFMYSPELLDLFAQVKAIFDPENLMNPGVLTAPMSPAQAQARRVERRSQDATAASQQDPQPGVDLVDQFLRRPAARRLLADGGFAFSEDGGDFSTAIHRCTGVGKCRATIPGTFMCPSWKASSQEKDVTRGRARTLQEAANGQLIAAIDSPEVLQALDLCLACKACSSDCPAGVDMARYRSEVLFRRYRGRIRPLSHYALGWLPRWTRLSARIPGVAAMGNALLSVDAIRRIVFSLIGLDARRPMPPLQSGTFSRWAKKRGLCSAVPSLTVSSSSPETYDPAKPLPEWPRDNTLTAEQSEATDDHGHATSPRDPHGRPYVVVWADSFSQTLDDTGARSVVELLERNGFAPIVAPDVCCGLTWVTTGQLAGARKKLTSLLSALAPFAANGIPIVGIEPSCTAVLRDDLRDLLPDDPRAHLVSQATQTLAELLSSVDPSERHLPDLTGVDVVAQPHCHHYSVMGWDADQALLESLGARVIRLDGCCGLAGNFGMERGHYDMSVAVASQSLLPALEQYPDAIYVADGFSCRTQAQQLAARGGVHLATLLASGPGGPAR